MTPEEEQAIRALHVPDNLPEGRTDHYCLDCDRPWPCDTTVVLAAYDKLAIRYGAANDAANAALAREKALAERMKALSDEISRIYDFVESSEPGLMDAYVFQENVRQHDEATR